MRIWIEIRLIVYIEKELFMTFGAHYFKGLKLIFLQELNMIYFVGKTCENQY